MVAPENYTYRHPHPAISVDIVVFTLRNESLQVLLVERGVEPHKGRWALPGGFLRIDEDLENAAERELKEETGIEGFFLEQIGAFGAPDRDPRERVVTVAYWAIISRQSLELAAGTDARKAEWVNANELPSLAFDHEEIITVAENALKDRLRNSSIALQFLPTEFTLTDLQRVHEQILGEPVDKRNFRKWIQESGLLRSTGRKEKGAKHRPAELFTAANPAEVAEVSLGRRPEKKNARSDTVLDKHYRKGYRDGVESVVRAAREILTEQ